MSKSRKEILQELLDLENENIEEIEDPPTPINTNEKLNVKETIDEITIKKKPRTQAQLDAFNKAKEIRDNNTKKRLEERQQFIDEERKKAEDKIIKKAISLKKKEIKKQAILDEISDDDTPIQKIKEIAKTSIKKDVIDTHTFPTKENLNKNSQKFPTKENILSKINFF